MSRILFAAKLRFRQNTGSDHYLQAVICKSPGGFLANEKEEKSHGMIIASFPGKQGKDIAPRPVESHTNLINLLGSVADIFATVHLVLIG